MHGDHRIYETSEIPNYQWLITIFKETFIHLFCDFPFNYDILLPAKKTQKSEAYGLGLDSLVLMIKQIRTFIHIDLINNLILGQVYFEHFHG